MYFWGIFQVKTLFQKFWPLLCKRAKLDLRWTKFFILNMGNRVAGSEPLLWEVDPPIIEV